MEDRWYVYIIFDPSICGKFIYGDMEFNMEPFYVGKGTKCRKSKTLNLNSANIYKKVRLSLLKSLGIRPIVEIYIEDVTDEYSKKIERELISIIGRNDKGLGPLTNRTDGGDSFSNTGELNPFFGCTHSEKIRQEHSDRVIGTNHPMYGKKHSHETIEKIKKSRKDNINQDEVNKRSFEIMRKTVLQFDLGGNFIQEFPSCKIAAKTLGVTESSVCRSCRGVDGEPRNSRKRKLTYKDSNEQIVLHHDLYGNFIQEFPSIHEASKYFGVRSSNIRKSCLSKITYTPRLFTFKYKNEKDLILRNSYVHKIGDIIDGLELIKRNLRSCIFKDMVGNIITIKKSTDDRYYQKKSLSN
jgi:hypothetical protein